jgi:protein-tyrosine phosphatase
MPEVLDWQRGDPQPLIARAVDLLAQGRRVALPTDTVYVALADARHADAVAGLPGGGAGLTVPVTGITAARAWVPDPPALALRFARRCWPGPLTLVLDAPAGQGQAAQLPDAVRQRLCGTGTVALNAPGHEAAQLLLRAAPFPVVAAPTAATTAPEAAAALGDAVALVLDGGPTQFGQPPTRVRVAGGRWSVAGEGVLSAHVLSQVAPCLVVFVCTGNTCRSPLAEALCKKLLAERLGCSVQDLLQKGYVVVSAGLAAVPGEPAAAEAVEVARAHGADLAGHQSQPLSQDLLAGADLVVAMTRNHLRVLAAYTGDGGAAPRLLMADGSDLPDPIGGPAEVYRACAAQIWQALQECLPALEQAGAVGAL